MGKQRKSAYAEEFRKEAVRLSQLPDRTATQVTKQLGVNAQQIANWKRQFTRLSDKQFNALEGIDYSKPLRVLIIQSRKRKKCSN